MPDSTALGGKVAMSSSGSVTQWLDQLQAGEHTATERIWQRYFERLVRLARKKLRGTPRRAQDEEDVALSAMGSFFQGVKQGRFPRLTDRDNLWPLLALITACKAYDLIEREGRKKRGAGKVLGESALEFLGTEGCAGLEQVVGREPGPETLLIMEEKLDCLKDMTLRQVAIWNLEGYTTVEIAGMLGCAERTVARKRELIRKIWLAEYPNG